MVFFPQFTMKKHMKFVTQNSPEIHLEIHPEIHPEIHLEIPLGIQR